MKIEVLSKLVQNQLENHFLTLSNDEKEVLYIAIKEANEKMNYRHQFISNPYYREFNPFHADQYASFLYTLSFIVSVTYNSKELADKIYYLNRIMNSINIYHEVELPKIFILEHPIGTILGRAKYGEKLIVYQNCTVGSSRDSEGKLFYPEIGEQVILYSNSSVIGKSKIGKNCIISSNTQILNEEIPDNSIVFGASPNLIIKSNKKDFKFFKEVEIKDE